MDTPECLGLYEGDFSPDVGEDYSEYYSCLWFYLLRKRFAQEASRHTHSDLEEDEDDF